MSKRSNPIRRTSKRDLIAAKALLYQYRRNTFPSTSKSPGYHFAIAKTVQDSSQQYHGAKADINTRSVKVLDSQFGEAFISIHNQFNGIHHGWAVNPQLYGDNLTRTFSSWTADAFERTGCFNSLCPDFVQISQKHYMGEALKISKYGASPHYVLDRLIFKDPKTGNWWIVGNPRSKQKSFIEYWPKSIFTTMADFASEIQFGGDVCSPISEPAPPMGSGDFNDNFKRTCYISRIRLVDSSNALFEPENISIQAFTDKPSCYQVSLKDMLCCLGDLEAQLVLLNEVKELFGHE
ncbi:hypothetical protein CK203_038804 [Vitis vinifera]|uniref:Neprosin PEP catalytic domain-containing protein n=1 Tax=Vitis vinifera TaxID=29760 RepID=A0A438I1K5_VITVI|nr:hypothetical protein CK203_038804 [Vitis vinifera]